MLMLPGTLLSVVLNCALLLAEPLNEPAQIPSGFLRNVAQKNQFTAQFLYWCRAFHSPRDLFLDEEQEAQLLSDSMPREWS